MYLTSDPSKALAPVDAESIQRHLPEVATEIAADSAREAERRRCEAILFSPEGQSRPMDAVASVLAIPGLSAGQAREMLAGMPIEGSDGLGGAYAP